MAVDGLSSGRGVVFLRWSRGADVIKPAPANATTSDNPPDEHKDHDLQLVEY
jgi:hypothetical protein